ITPRPRSLKYWAPRSRFTPAMKTASTTYRYGTCAGCANFTRSVQISFWAFLPFRNKSGNFFCSEYRLSRSPLGLRFCLLEHISLCFIRFPKVCLTFYTFRHIVHIMNFLGGCYGSPERRTADRLAAAEQRDQQPA